MAGGSPAGWTLVTMDAVGRVTEVDLLGTHSTGPLGRQHSKTGTATYAYDQAVGGCTGPAVKATDEAVNTKYTCLDALDRLVSVTEPDASSGGPGTVTTYGYDSLGNLSAVDVSGQPALSCGHMRCFNYSTLSRLLTATNPESGTTTYTYDNNGNPRMLQATHLLRDPLPAGACALRHQTSLGAPYSEPSYQLRVWQRVLWDMALAGRLAEA